MLVNFVPNEHHLELQVPAFCARDLPALTRFFVVHVVYSRDQPMATVHVYEHGRVTAFTATAVMFGS